MPLGAPPLHRYAKTISMIKWIRTSRLSIKNSLFGLDARVSVRHWTLVQCRGWRGRRERLVIYCQTSSVSAAHATHCAAYCRPLLPVFSGWILTAPPTIGRRERDCRGKGITVGTMQPEWVGCARNPLMHGEAASNPPKSNPGTKCTTVNST